MTPRELARRFVEGHEAVAALERERLRQAGPDCQRAFADAMALFDAVAEMGELSPEILRAREREDEQVRATWAKLRERLLR
ncbi:MAG TPA: hypothetical protein VFS00_19350 [Polyangiaceae bacterium]|nr:hypothetical protein [Polyangiaceae bacterium]